MDGPGGGSRPAAFTGPGKVWGVMRKAPKGSGLHPVDVQINRVIAMVRAKVEGMALRETEVPEAQKSRLLL